MIMNEKMFTFIFVIFCTCTMKAQQLRMIVQTSVANPSDPVVYEDTVWVGFHPEATLGIDTLFGEKDISNQPPFGNIDVRVIQRNMDNWICPYFNEMLFPASYNETFDSRINYRSPKNGEWTDGVFHVQVNAVATALALIFDTDNLYSETIEKVILSRDSCDSFPGIVDSTIFVDADSFGATAAILTPNVKFVTIFFREELFTNTSKTFHPSSTLIAFPNPFTHTLFIEEENLQKPNITAINTLGQSMPIDFFQNGTKIEINTTNWPPGAYFIQLWSNEGKLLKRGKAIKHF